jgi:hypothetical protein
MVSVKRGEKDKFVPVLNYAPLHEDVWGSGCIDPVILISAVVGGEWSASRPGPLYPEENNPRYPLGRRLGGPQSRPGRYEETKLASAGN